MKYRIRYNEIKGAYIAERKWFCFWLTVERGISEQYLKSNPELLLLDKDIMELVYLMRETEFSSKEIAEQAIENHKCEVRLNKSKFITVENDL